MVTFVEFSNIAQQVENTLSTLESDLKFGVNALAGSMATAERMLVASGDAPNHSLSFYADSAGTSEVPNAHEQLWALYESEALPELV